MPVSQRDGVQRVLDRLSTFDALDFNVFTPSSRRHPSDHEELSVVFGFAPDARMEDHPQTMGSGEWTAVMGFVAGTFTKEMTMPDGQTIPATGKAFRIAVCTIGHWTDGVMDEKYLFWDNDEFMQQVGLSH